MIRPLSLIPAKQQPRGDTYQINSPLIRKRADSLVFSITSEKHYCSPKQTNLLQSKQNEVSKELQTLQLKLENLQSRVQRIDSQPFSQNIYVPNVKKGYQSDIFLKTSKNLFHKDKENRDVNITKVGKIVKKDKDFSKTTKFEKNVLLKPKIYPFATNSRHSLASQESMLVQKVKELQKLKKEVTVMKQSVQKSERSKSICSQRLSASKSIIKNMKKQQKKKDKIIQRLRNQLKKSQNIKQKQKCVILKQQQQLRYFRQLVGIHKKIR